MPDSSPATTPPTFGHRLSLLREEHHLTREQVADAVKVDRSTVGRWENDVTEPSVTDIRELAKLLGCTADYLLLITDYPQPLRSGDWIVDLDVVARLESGGQVLGHEATATPIPNRFRICTSSEYAAIDARLRYPQRRKRS